MGHVLMEFATLGPASPRRSPLASWITRLSMAGGITPIKPPRNRALHADHSGRSLPYPQ